MCRLQQQFCDGSEVELWVKLRSPGRNSDDSCAHTMRDDFLMLNGNSQSFIFGISRGDVLVIRLVLSELAMWIK